MTTKVFEQNVRSVFVPREGGYWKDVGGSIESKRNVLALGRNSAKINPDLNFGGTPCSTPVKSDGQTLVEHFNR
jgi:hypothetical protein